mgnify:CR=1 FL=1
MLQLRDLPNEEILKKFEQRYPDADIASIIIFLRLLRVTSDLSSRYNCPSHNMSKKSSPRPALESVCSSRSCRYKTFHSNS